MDFQFPISNFQSRRAAADRVFRRLLKLAIGNWQRAILFLTFAATLSARDAFVMLSGGVSPFDNNYSQYLQARAVTTFLQKNYPRDSVWIFFGAGNVEGEKPVFGDVFCTTNRNGAEIPSWVAGSLPRNLSARRDVVLRVLNDEILPAVAGGGTLFLFVGDHGEKMRGTNGECVINLWELEPAASAEHGWRKNDKASLSVSELRSMFNRRLGKGRVVFCMTQCHSGGFHYLAMPRDLTPSPKWFTRGGAGASAPPASSFPLAAGFTATDEFSPAAGCVADPDPSTWAGYERYVPENLLGLDLFTLKPTGRILQSFAEAHVAATLADETLDKPRSSSEHYLERWANLIETRLATETNLTSKIKRLVTAYQRATDTEIRKTSDTALRQQQEVFRRFTEKMCEQNPRVKTLLLTGTRRELEAAAGKTVTNRPPANPTRRPPPPRRRGGGRMSQARKLWNDTVRPEWERAVQANHVSDILPANALDFEKHLLELERRGTNFFGRGQDRLLREAFWESGYSNPQTTNPAKAAAVAQWGALRGERILSWARTSKGAEVRAAAERLGEMTNVFAPEPETTAAKPALSKKVAAERALFYRRILAAWEFLLAANEQPALNRLRELIELERTPLPPPSVDGAASGR